MQVKVVSSFIGKILGSTVVNHRDRVDLQLRGNGDNRRGRYSTFTVGGETCLDAGTRQSERESCSGNRRTARLKAKGGQRLTGGQVTTDQITYRDGGGDAVFRRKRGSRGYRGYDARGGGYNANRSGRYDGLVTGRHLLIVEEN